MAAHLKEVACPKQIDLMRDLHLWGGLHQVEVAHALLAG